MADTTETKLSDADQLSEARPYNQRINLSLDEEEDEFQHDEGGPDMDDEELTRDKVKRASTQILQAVDRRKRRAAASTAKKAMALDGSASPEKEGGQ